MKKIAMISLEGKIANTSLLKKQITKEIQKGYSSFCRKINDDSFVPGSDSIYGSPQLFGGLQQQFLYS
jgi:hypothetical protein